MDSHTEQHFPIHRYLRVLQKRKGLLVLVVLATFTAIVLGLRVQEPPSDAPPIFTSHLKLLVTPSPDQDEESDSELLRTWFASEQLLKQLVLSEEVLTRVSQTGELPYDWLALKSMISFSPPPDTQQRWNDAWGSFIIEFDVEADSPEESQKVAQLISDEVIAYTQELGAREAIAARKLLEKMAVKHKKQIEAAQKAIVDWRQENDIWDLEQLVAAQGIKINDLETERDSKSRELSGLQEKVTQLYSYRDQKGEAPPYDILALETQNLDRLASTRDRLGLEVKKLRQVYTEESSVLRDKVLEYNDAVAAYQAERHSLFDSLITKAQSQVTESKTAVGQLNARINNLKGDKGLAKAQVELQRLQHEVSSQQASYEQVLAQINDITVQEQAKKHLANFTVLEKPLPGVPFEFSAPDKNGPSFYLSALLLSVLAGVAAVIGFDTLNRDSQLRPQVEGLGLPILGTIPRIESKDGHRRMLEEPDSIFAERIRSLIVNLMRLKKPVNKVLVTSCWPEEGKSMISVNLATGLSRFGLKVFLADGDLRRPFLTNYFEKDEDPGFREFLKGELPLDELTQPTKLGFNLLPAGQGDDNAAELMLERKSLSPLAGDSDQRFLIIDSSPLSVCSDSIQLSDDVDGVILVINAKHWDGKAELDYVLELEEQGVPLLGVILNNVRETELTYGYGKIHKGYYGKQKSESSLKELFKR